MSLETEDGRTIQFILEATKDEDAMHFEDEYRYGIMLARNQWIIRNTRDPKLKARVAKDSQKIRAKLQRA